MSHVPQRMGHVTRGAAAVVIYSHTLQHPATHCNTLQHTATHCNTLQKKIYTRSAAVAVACSLPQARTPFHEHQTDSER